MALFLWAVTFLLHHWSAEWMDAIALYAQLPVVTKFVSGASNTPIARFFRARSENLQEKCSLKQPLWMLISEKYHAERFNSTTPIDRRKLVMFLEKVRKFKGPGGASVKILALDYDLSPKYDWENCKGKEGKCEDPKLHEDQTALDNYLSGLVNPLNPPSKIPVILLEPWFGSDKIQTQNKGWKNTLEREGVRFANADLLHHKFLSTVTRYEDPDYNYENQSFKASRRCPEMFANLIRQLSDDDQVTNTDASSSKERKKIPINYFSAKGNFPVCRITDDNDLAKDEGSSCWRELNDLGRRSIQWNGTVVIGGDYGETDDQYRTPLGTLSGVRVHSYIHYSLCDRLKPGHIWSMIIEIGLFGIILGCILEPRWRKYRRARGHIAFRMFMACRIFLVFALFIILALCVVAAFMIIGKWVNPLIMMIGILIHSFLIAIDDHPAQASNGKFWWKRFFGVFDHHGYQMIFKSAPDKVVYWARMQIQFMVFLGGIFFLIKETFLE